MAFTRSPVRSRSGPPSFAHKCTRRMPRRSVAQRRGGGVLEPVARRWLYDARPFTRSPVRSRSLPPTSSRWFLWLSEPALKPARSEIGLLRGEGLRRRLKGARRFGAAQKVHVHASDLVATELHVAGAGPPCRAPVTALREAAR